MLGRRLRGPLAKGAVLRYSASSSSAGHRFYESTIFVRSAKRFRSYDFRNFLEIETTRANLSDFEDVLIEVKL